MSRDRRRRQIDDSEEDEVDVRDVKKKRNKRKSMEIEDIEVGEDVKMTRPGRIIRDLAKDEPKDLI